jgi:hypothetical protein
MKRPGCRRRTWWTAAQRLQRNKFRQAADAPATAGRHSPERPRPTASLKRVSWRASAGSRCFRASAQYGWCCGTKTKSVSSHSASCAGNFLRLGGDWSATPLPNRSKRSSDRAKSLTGQIVIDHRRNDIADPAVNASLATALVSFRRAHDGFASHKSLPRMREGHFSLPAEIESTPSMPVRSLI